MNAARKLIFGLTAAVPLFAAGCGDKVTNNYLGNDFTCPYNGPEDQLPEPYLGKKGAPVTITVYGGLAEPYTGQFMRNTLPAIEQNHVNRGNVRVVYTNNPLDFVLDDHSVANATEAANEQGGFWKFAQALMEGKKFGKEDIRTAAEKAGLDKERFNRYFDNNCFVGEVENDIQIARNLGFGIGSPIISISNEQYTTYVLGAQPYEVFDSIIGSMIKTPSVPIEPEVPVKGKIPNFSYPF